LLVVFANHRKARGEI